MVHMTSTRSEVRWRVHVLSPATYTVLHAVVHPDEHLSKLVKAVTVKRNRRGKSYK